MICKLLFYKIQQLFYSSLAKTCCGESKKQFWGLSRSIDEGSYPGPGVIHRHSWRRHLLGRNDGTIGHQFIINSPVSPYIDTI